MARGQAALCMASSSVYSSGVDPEEGGSLDGQAIATLRLCLLLDPERATRLDIVVATAPGQRLPPNCEGASVKPNARKAHRRRYSLGLEAALCVFLAHELAGSQILPKSASDPGSEFSSSSVLVC